MKIVVLVGLCLVGTVGCAPMATYPAAVGSADLTEPTLEPIPTLMSESIRYARDHFSGVKAFAINLPPQTPPEVYRLVIERLGDIDHPLFDSDEPAYHVMEVRARTLTAEVDLYYPRADGYYEFVTVSFRRNAFRGFEARSTRLWRTVNRPPQPNYRSAPLEAASAQPDGDEP